MTRASGAGPIGAAGSSSLANRSRIALTLLATFSSILPWWTRPLRSSPPPETVRVDGIANEEGTEKTRAPVDHARDLVPIFVEHCVECHGARRQRGGLRLDSAAGLARGADSGAVYVARDPAASRLLALVRGVDDERMPPKGPPLSPGEIAIIEAWIVEGAPLPDTSTPGTRETIESDHWSLRPLVRPSPPASRLPRRDPIDAFVDERLDSAGLSPSPRAERATRLRRITFDLTGLPPSPAELEQFLSDEEPEAWARVVDRLLASPALGERWGRHWLDVARYTESQGFEYDRLRDRAWHYRDWVIASVNHDLPYDEFVRQQIAGDVLEPVTSDSMVATSFLVCGPWDQAGNSQANQTQRMITREEELEDLVSVVSQSFLGLTVNCARCHSHKYDPIPQEDYYRFKSVFEGVVHGEREIVSAEEKSLREARRAELEAGIGAARDEVLRIESAARERVLARLEELGTTEPSPPPPPALALWDFATGSPQDRVGALHGSLRGGARIENGALLVDGRGGYFESAAISGDLREKTLEVRLSLPTLDQGGGGAISVQSGDGRIFDAIVFAEREPRKWMVGSNGFARTIDLDAPPETAGPEQSLHLACVWRSDGTIRLYRDGVPHGQDYARSAEPVTFRAGDAHVVLGLRHSGGGRAFLAARITSAAIHDRALDESEIAAAFGADGSRVVSREQLERELTRDERLRREQLLASIRTMDREIRSVPAGETSYVGTRRQPAPTHLLEQGNVTRPGRLVDPGGLQAVATPSADLDLPSDAPEADRRRRFAKWITDPRHPLPARTIANRVWHHHFGRGIAATPNDLGASGETPTHPELIDWLACELIESGFSLKSLHRQILLSETYQRSSAGDSRAAAVDLESRLLWRFPPRRLEAEALRDTLLAVSGQLDRSMGGPSFRPFKVSTFGSAFYEISDDDDPSFRRRTVYRMNVSSGKDPFLEVFDCPDPSVKTPDRAETSTPLQALSLMNNPLVLRTARALVERLSPESDGRGADDAALAPVIERAFLLLFSRMPRPEETARAAAVAREHGLETVLWALLNTTELLHVR